MCIWIPNISQCSKPTMRHRTSSTCTTGGAAHIDSRHDREWQMLAQHLREMERDGLIIRTDLSGRLRHVEYSLSDSGGFCCIATHQSFDRMGLTICAFASEARTCSLVWNNRVWLAGLQIFFSAGREPPTGLALREPEADACVQNLPVKHPPLRASAVRHLD